MAGLGEIGWSKVFLTPEFGPRNRFAILLTDAVLEPDSIYDGHICDRCKQCVKYCSGHAISMTESVKITVAGHEIEWNKLDERACEIGLNGGINGELDPFDGKYPNQFGYGRAIEGAAGCIRACMVHLEKRRKQDIFDNYVKTGMIEDYMEQIRYDEEENYKMAKKSNGSTADLPISD